MYTSEVFTKPPQDSIQYESRGAQKKILSAIETARNAFNVAQLEYRSIIEEKEHKRQFEQSWIGQEPGYLIVWTNWDTNDIQREVFVGVQTTYKSLIFPIYAAAGQSEGSSTYRYQELIDTVEQPIYDPIQNLHYKSHL